MRILRTGARDPALSICIPTLDCTARHVQDQRASILKHTDHISHEIVTADCQGQRIGYTAPQNAAMAAAKAPYLLALNDDVELAPGWLGPLLEAAGAGVWCTTPDMTHTDGPQVFAPYCMLWRRDGWSTIGGLDERFRMWCSDIDIARRLVDAGHPPRRVRLPVPIQHAVGTTSTATPELQSHFSPIIREDMDAFVAKWGVSAENEKYRLAAL